VGMSQMAQEIENPQLDGDENGWVRMSCLLFGIVPRAPALFERVVWILQRLVDVAEMIPNPNGWFALSPVPRLTRDVRHSGWQSNPIKYHRY